MSESEPFFAVVGQLHSGEGVVLYFSRSKPACELYARSRERNPNFKYPPFVVGRSIKSPGEPHET